MLAYPLEYFETTADRNVNIMQIYNSLSIQSVHFKKRTTFKFGKKWICLMTLKKIKNGNITLFGTCYSLTEW